MRKDIKDYLHLYLGCDAVDHTGWKTTVEWSDIGYPDQIKQLILRPLSDITEKEVEDLRFNMPGGVTVPNDRQALDITPHQVKYLLSLGFDLFNLIDEGLAIDKTTLTN